MNPLVKSWKTEVIYGAEWSVSPGVEWCAAGCRIQLHANVSIGDWARIGDRASIGDGASIGGETHIGDRASISDGARIGDGAKFLFDLGSFEGYRKVICDLNGVAYIGAGCRWLTLADAIKNWPASRKSRPITHAMLETAKTVANIYKLKYS